MTQKPTPVTCRACKRGKRVPDEGRNVDGSWPSDQQILAHIRRRPVWVCGWNCYQKLLELLTTKRQ
jgi:hypothetical protein